MIKLTIDNEHDENINVDKALIVVGEFDDEDILNYICHAASTGLRTVLRCDNEDLQELDFSNPKKLTSRIAAFEDIWSQMKLNVFMDVFE